MIKELLPPWALIIIVLGIVFLLLTRDSLNRLVDQASVKIKNRIFDFRRKGDEQRGKTEIDDVSEKDKLKKLYKELQVEDIDEIYSVIENSKKTVEESHAQQNTLFQLWKHYMFAYLNFYLVPRSKLILMWLHTNENSTRELLCLNISIPNELNNKELEIESVFNALLTNGLIEKDSNELYKVTNLGRDYLQSTGLIKVS